MQNMQKLSAFIVLVIGGALLAGCSTSQTMGVLPREPVPPPPSARNTLARNPETLPRPAARAQPRQGLSVPDRIVTPRPSP